MAVFNLGSINIDLIYSVSNFPAPGETLAAEAFQRMPGGKGANQSVALALAGAKVFHIGAMHGGDDWLKRHLSDAGVDLGFVQLTETPGGHAIVVVNADGENQIILFPGANHEIDMTRACAALEEATADDWALIQNETNGAAEFVAAARRADMKIAYAAAPFDAEVTLALLPQVDLLMVNAIEAAALMAATGGDENSLGVDHLVITRGSAGVTYSGIAGQFSQPAFTVDVVDTTGAGDCFSGYFLAALDEGRDVPAALNLASAAAALQVTRHGDATAIPTLDEVTKFLEDKTA